MHRLFICDGPVFSATDVVQISMLWTNAWIIKTCRN